MNAVVEEKEKLKNRGLNDLVFWTNNLLMTASCLSFQDLYLYFLHDLSLISSTSLFNSLSVLNPTSPFHSCFIRYDTQRIAIIKKIVLGGRQGEIQAVRRDKM